MSQPDQATVKEQVSYDPETGAFRRKVARGGAKVGDVAGYLGKTRYWYISINNREYLAHRLAFVYMTGKWPLEQVDHINRDRADNRFCNLREASSLTNCRNMGKRWDNTSGHTGVYWHKPTSNWTAMIFYFGKTISLGYFDRIEDAIAARQKAVDENYGRSPLPPQAPVSLRASSV